MKTNIRRTPRFESFTIFSACSLYLAFITIIVTAMAFWTDRNLDFWLSHFKGEDVNCPFWMSLLVSLLAPVVLLLNILAEIARLCV